MSENWVAAGRLIRPRGNRGELIAEIYSSRPGRAEMLKSVMLEREGRRHPAEVERVWHHDGRPVFKLAGIDSISAAEEWAGADILVAAAERVKPDPGEYSHADLIGCKVIGHEMAGDEPIGVVSRVEEFGGAPLLAVDVANGKEALIPFVRAICREVDVDAKVIRVELPEGLLEL